jgi:hypothetical protein
LRCAGLIGCEIFQGEQSEFKAVARANLFVEVRETDLYGSLGDSQSIGDFLILEALRQHSHNLALPWSQPHTPGLEYFIADVAFHPELAGGDLAQTFEALVDFRIFAQNAKNATPIA